MMADSVPRLPAPPPEVPESHDLRLCAPNFVAQITQLIGDMRARGHDATVFEAFRSDERQRWLYGLGREYIDPSDPDRVFVTNAMDGRKSWHRYGLAVDIISRSRQWDAPLAFWDDLHALAEIQGLTSGAGWSHPDRPHVQWHTAGMPVTPSVTDWDLLQSHGVEAVWRLYGAAPNAVIT